MNKKGFTLLELLVVISIMGLISTVAFAALSTARAKARDAVRKSDIRQIAIALQLYYDTNGVMRTIVLGCPFGATFMYSSNCPVHWSETFIPDEFPNMPLDSLTGDRLPDALITSFFRREYVYRYTSSTRVRVLSQLENNDGAPLCDGTGTQPTVADNINCAAPTGCVVPVGILQDTFGSDPWICQIIE